jgi:hypothetical protein
MTTATPTRPTDLELHRVAETFLLAMMSSANVDRIGVARWWDRARTSLETGAACSTSWREMVSKVGRKLLIDSLNEDAAITVAGFNTMLDDPATFARFREICARNALTFPAKVRQQKVADRKEPK